MFSIILLGSNLTFLGLRRDFRKYFLFLLEEDVKEVYK